MAKMTEIEPYSTREKKVSALHRANITCKLQ